MVFCRSQIATGDRDKPVSAVLGFPGVAGVPGSSIPEDAVGHGIAQYQMNRSSITVACERHLRSALWVQGCQLPLVLLDIQSRHLEAQVKIRVKEDTERALVWSRELPVQRGQHTSVRSPP